MEAFLPYLILILLGVIAIVLSAGLLNMARGGSSNRSQKLMRLRVATQFVALIIMVAVLYFFGKS